MTQIIMFIFTFLLGYTVTHYTLVSWSVRTLYAIIAGIFFGLLVAFLAINPL